MQERTHRQNRDSGSRGGGGGGRGQFEPVVSPRRISGTRGNNNNNNNNRRGRDSQDYKVQHESNFSSSSKMDGNIVKTSMSNPEHYRRASKPWDTPETILHNTTEKYEEGTVQSVAKNHGFITRGNSESKMYFHFNNVTNGQTLRVNDKVSYVAIPFGTGYEAVDVSLKRGIVDNEGESLKTPKKLDSSSQPPSVTEPPLTKLDLRPAWMNKEKEKGSLKKPPGFGSNSPGTTSAGNSKELDLRPAWMNKDKKIPQTGGNSTVSLPVSLNSSRTDLRPTWNKSSGNLIPKQSGLSSTVVAPSSSSTGTSPSSTSPLSDDSLMSERRREPGEVKTLKDTYGFIKHNNRSLFFRRGDLTSLNEGDRVDFFIIPDPRNPNDVIASHVRLIASNDPMYNIGVMNENSEFRGGGSGRKPGGIGKDDGDKFSKPFYILKWLEQLENNGDPLALLFQRRDLEQILTKPSLTFKIMRKLLEILTSSTVRSSDRTEAIFRAVLDSNFMRNPNNLNSYILKLQSTSPTETIEEQTKSITSVICLVEELLDRFPFEYSKLPFDALERVIGQKHPYDEYIVNSIQHLIEKKKLARVQATKQALAENTPSGPKIGKLIEDIKDFRDIPVFPNSSEILSDRQSLREKLSKNKTTRAYDNVMQYLDTHFRLLREDCITSIRDGIIAYRKNKDSENRELAVYTSVMVVGVQCAREGIVYRVSFDIDCDVTWTRTKRLIYGSLLCLSPDNFNTLLWVTVASRDPELLALKQQVDIRFPEGVKTDFVNINSHLTYTMVESTSTYFEAYQHVLSALQRIEVNKFPFINHLIKCDVEVGPPSYLTPNNNTYHFENVFDGGTTDFAILGKWPSHVTSKSTSGTLETSESDLSSTSSNGSIVTSMDQTQLDAFKRALTKNFAIIQGPPGTGKTFVGLKVMRALLDNSAIRERAGCSGPILVICFTNHALDQFLEGVLSFEQNLVRIGSRSKSELLKEYNLKDKLYLSTAATQHRRARRQLNEKLKELEEEISQCFTKLNKFDLTREDLEEIGCSETQLNSLYSQHRLEELDNILKEWLGIEPKEIFQKKSPIPPSPRLGDPRNVHSRHHHKIDVEAEVDEELIELTQFERMVDEDDDGQKRQMFEVAPDSVSFDLSTLEPLSENLRHSLDLWNLPKSDRQHLYRHWLKEFRSDQGRRLTMLCRQYEGSADQKIKLEDELKITVLTEARVIGMTTTGVAKFQKLIQAVRPSVVMVEEAAEVLEAHIITALSATTKHLILIGDHEQLRPTTAVYDLSTRFQLDVSLFERMVLNGVEHSTLLRQRRMRPEISSLLTTIYPKLYNHPDVEAYPFVRGLCQNLYFLSHNFPETQHAEGLSKSNPHEAAFLARFCRYLLLQGYQDKQITILTAYSGQVKILRENLKSLKASGDWSDCKEDREDMHIDRVYVTSVDNYQGEENDIILLSLVRSNTKGIIGFLNTSNRICVALSRAKHGMFVIGNGELLSSKNAVWNTIIDMFKKKKCFGNSLILMCQNHPTELTSVKDAIDFKAISDGGCKLLCRAKLPCGHTCPHKCHPFSHEKINCLQKVIVTRKCGHVANQKLCYEELDECTDLVKRTLPCGHTQEIPCYKEDWSTVSCVSPCSKEFKCGHKCPLRCAEKCPKKCSVIVVKQLDCGHKVELECSQNLFSVVCDYPH